LMFNLREFKRFSAEKTSATSSLYNNKMFDLKNPGISFHPMKIPANRKKTHIQYMRYLEQVLVFLNDFNRTFKLIHLALMNHQ